jgi:hypothetical protein
MDQIVSPTGADFYANIKKILVPGSKHIYLSGCEAPRIWMTTSVRTAAGEASTERERRLEIYLMSRQNFTATNPLRAKILIFSTPLSPVYSLAIATGCRARKPKET